MFIATAAVGSKRASVTYGFGAANSTNPITSLAASGSFGVAASDRVIFLFLFVDQSVSITVSIGGVGATNVYNPGPGISVWRAAVPSGTSGTVSISFSANVLFAAFNIFSTYALRNPGTPLSLPGQTSGAAPTNTVNTASGGVLMAFATRLFTTSFTWTNATEQSDAVSGLGVTYSGAMTSQTTGATGTVVTANGGATSFLVAGTWR